MTTQLIASSDGIHLNVTTWGEPENTPVVLVHGFPDSHTVWLPVIGHLEPNFYVIAYDVRGAGKSEVPKRVSDYKLDQLTRDLAAVVDNIIPNRKFHLVGHDWGSVQSWHSVSTSQLEGRIASFTTISGPSLDHGAFWMRNQLFSFSISSYVRLFRQLYKSWYIFMFQLPWYPEYLWQNRTSKIWSRFLEKKEDVVETTASPTLLKDGTNGINLYRANFLQTNLFAHERHAHCPVQLVVLNKDNYISPYLFDDLSHWVNQLYRRELDEKHWAILIKPEIIANYINEFVIAVEEENLDKLESLKVTN